MSEPISFPRLRWVCVLGLAVWFPTYAVVWGWANFVQLCDLSVLLTVAGVWTGSALLLSSQAVGTIVLNSIWALDAAWRLAAGHHLIGGTEYLWDARYPLWVRLLSLYHVAIPLVALWALRRTGYHLRGWQLQAALSVPALIASRLLDPANNVNFAHVDPILHISFRPAPLHLAIILFFLIGVIYWPTHQVLSRIFPPVQPRK
ncbi:MAG: hypothetical protein HY234_14590 [Acidobacteria bacterium]|nr:hypothetical protein [Acidobacteriota bacterium]